MSFITSNYFKMILNKIKIYQACLPNLKWNKNFPIPQTTAYILGWGTISEGGPTPDTLKNAKITIYDGIKCNKVISENKKIWDSLICAGLKKFHSKVFFLKFKIYFLDQR